MANVTITRPDGSIETIILAEATDAGYDYYPFTCSDGKIRYALLGKQTDTNASHFWVEKSGVRKYALKDPSLVRHISVTKNDTIQNYWLAKATDVNAAPPAGGSADWTGNGPIEWDPRTDKVLFVSLQLAAGYEPSSYKVSGIDGLAYLQGMESGYSIFKAINPVISADVALAVTADKQTIPSGVFGKTLNVQTMSGSDSFTATVPEKITVLKLDATMGDGSKQTKYIGVTAGKSYTIQLTNYNESGSAGSISWYAWSSVLMHYISDKTGTNYISDGDGGVGISTAAAGKFVYSATFTYSAEISSHAVDIQDY